MCDATSTGGGCATGGGCQTRPMQQRRLLLIRHAEAADAPLDADRPLTERGTRHAAAIGSWLEQGGLMPDRVVVSPARRAAQTWDRAGAPLVPDLQPIVDPRIYDNTVEALLAAIRETPEDVRTLAVVGHNPSVGELAGVLDDGQSSPAARRDLDAGFRTGGVAVFVLAAPFPDIAPGTATLRDFTVPGG
jgi:phosphohistidine phosphatase